jgi:hypothetical protein
LSKVIARAAGFGGFTGLLRAIPMTSVMAIIQESPAETSTGHNRPRAGFGQCLLALALALLTASGFANAQQIENQSSGSLAVPQGRRQTEVLPPAWPMLPRQSGGNVLVIPRASRDFVGEWGGHLHLTRVLGIVPASPDSIVSLAFGETRGTVFMQTTAFARRSSQIVKTSAEVVNPRMIELKLKGLELTFTPPIVHKEELHLALTAKNTISCLKYVDFYEPGRKLPIASMAYEGKLHPLTAEQRRALTEQVLQKGQIPQKRIESSRSFGP